MLAAEIRELKTLGIRYVMPFGISHHKDAIGSDTWNDDGLLARMIRTIKQEAPEMLVIPDICFCEYTDHGHCGVVEHNEVCNDATVENLVKQSVCAARAGADMLAPSAMMDGRSGPYARAWMRPVLKMSPFWPTRPSLPPLSTAHSGRR